MKLSILFVSLLLISSVAFAEPCSEKEIAGFEKYLEALKLNVSKALEIIPEEELCKIHAHKEMLQEVEDIESTESYKKRACEEAVDLCNDLRDDEGEFIGSASFIKLYFVNCNGASLNIKMDGSDCKTICLSDE